MTLPKAILFFLFFLGEQLNNHHVAAENMNGEYIIANSDAFDTNYKTEYFDAYSKPIKTLYSQVHWKNHGQMPLPQKIIERFADGGLMAITGYEVDQVMKTETGEEVSVPISWAYNHHYGANILNSKKVKLVKKNVISEISKLGISHGAEEHWVPEVFGVEDDDDDLKAQLQFFSEGNGGEMRKSFHGYPKGFAQIVESPDSYTITPMQIDTWNRNMKNYTFIPGPLPKSSRISSTAGYNGLLECPCSDRIKIEWNMTYTLSDTDKCTGPIESAEECFFAAKQVIKSDEYRMKKVSDYGFISGCSSMLNDNGSLDVVWNTPIPGQIGDTTVESGNSNILAGVALGLINMTVTIDAEDAESAVKLKFTGPADKWFGVGFGADTMCLHSDGDECPGGGPYAVIVSNETIVERKLDYHGPGSILNKSLHADLNQVEEGIRTVHLSRPLEGLTEDHYTFDPSLTSIPLIMAKGCDLEFAQHCGHGSNEVNLLPVGTPKKICQTGIEGSIHGNKFNNHRCAPFPRSVLLDQNNPTCQIQTYKGGLSCCVHDNYLLDKDQEIPWDDQPLEYYLKFRFYFEGFKKAANPNETDSHKQLIRLYWQTEAHAGEYDVVQCREGTPSSECVQVITSRWTVRDMMHDCPLHDASWCTGVESSNSSQTDGVKLIYAGPHCHAGTCLSMDLYNSDTGSLLCHVEPIYGQGKEMYDEKEYLAIPPCLWGDSSEGLQEPELLSLDTNLLSIKRNNNTLPHTGDMASWQMRGILVRKKTDEVEEEVMADLLRSQPLLRSSVLASRRGNTPRQEEEMLD